MKEEQQESGWTISIGFYPGILFGARTYEYEGGVQHVFYLPLIDFCIDIYNG
jgi:hypothetical protein